MVIVGGVAEYTYLVFCYYEKILEAGYFIKKRALFWLMVLEVQVKEPHLVLASLLAGS
jgi:hypothetical protein